MQKFGHSETCVNGSVWDREDSLTPLRSSYTVHLAQSSEKGSAYAGSALEPQHYAMPLSHATEKGQLRKLGGSLERWAGGLLGGFACVPNGLPSEDEASMNY